MPGRGRTHSGTRPLIFFLSLISFLHVPTLLVCTHPAEQREEEYDGKDDWEEVQRRALMDDLFQRAQYQFAQQAGGKEGDFEIKVSVESLCEQIVEEVSSKIGVEPQSKQ